MNISSFARFYVFTIALQASLLAGVLTLLLIMRTEPRERQAPPPQAEWCTSINTLFDGCKLDGGIPVSEWSPGAREVHMRCIGGVR